MLTAISEPITLKYNPRLIKLVPTIKLINYMYAILTTLSKFPRFEIIKRGIYAKLSLTNVSTVRPYSEATSILRPAHCNDHSFLNWSVKYVI